MCGICGIFNYRSIQPVAQASLERMAAAMRHRGPDDEGYYIDGPLGFGFRRLSIIDLGGGHQPMSDIDGKTWIVFNGEIYNYPELKKELEGFGYVFRTTCDTEVIVNGYRQWGVEVVQHLNGMFGFAIWDSVNRRLLLSRDRMGIKPVYYSLRDGGLVFGSEIKTLLASGVVAPEVNTPAMALFLQFRYVPSPHTIFKGIQKLAPGTRLIVENQTVTYERWWNYKPELKSQETDAREIKEHLKELYQRSVQRHLLSDVPIGLLLSGGLDSSLLLALAHSRDNPIDTYSVGFGSSHVDDELEAAQYTAKHFGARNTRVTLDRPTFESALDTVVASLEEPVAASSIIPMYFVCKRASEDLKVVLMGQGPDELFGGYTRHLGVRYGGVLPRWGWSILKNVGLPFVRNETLRRGLLSQDIDDRWRRYQRVFALAEDSFITGLFQQGIISNSFGDAVLDAWNLYTPLLTSTDELTGFQCLEIRSSLPDELLLYADKLSMAHSLEVRVPYLDKEIVEYAEQIPGYLKIRGFNRKWIHREICKEFLPKAIVQRRKLGFETPVGTWMRDSIGGKMEKNLLDPQSKMYKYFSHKSVASFIEAYRRGHVRYYKILFSLVVLEEWMRKYLP